MTEKTFKHGAELLSTMTALTEEFARDVIALPIPDEPTRLSEPRKAWAHAALLEEVGEFHEAETLEDEVDALVDMTYFACGRLVEMGVFPRAVFEEVHVANMGKVRGELAKRPNSLGHDAVKPEGWKGPDHSAFLRVSREEVFELCDAHLEWPRILVMGHAHHGKDTLCELMADHYGLAFTSSSEFCAERVVYPEVRRLWHEHEPSDTAAPSVPLYANAQECFEDRSNHRKFWFDTITAFNTPDKTRQGREIYETNDVYCGVRNADEFNALKSAGVFDVAVWVDASDRVPPEHESSCTVTRDMADYVVENNGPESGLYAQLHELMRAIA